MQVLGSNGQIINSVEDWHNIAPPAKPNHWKDGRSAKELAIATFRPGQPALMAEVQEMLNAHELTHGYHASQAYPEHKTILPPVNDGPRQHDLLVDGVVSGQIVILGIEAKADEDFQEPLSVKIENAPDGSRIPDRVNALCRMAFGQPYGSVFAPLRYQLLTGFVGTAIETGLRNAQLGVFVVVEFITNQTDDAKHEQNHEDWEAFVKSLPNVQMIAPVVGKLMGPVNVNLQGHIAGAPDLLLGKVQINLRTV